MDAYVHASPEVQLLARKIDLPARFLRFEITDLTRQNLKAVQPILHEHLNGLSARFYEFLRRFPEADRIFQSHDSEVIRQHLQRHWMRVLQGHYDDEYVISALTIGYAHYKAHVSPHMYMAGYNYFLSSFLQVITTDYRGSDFVAATGSVSKVILFDMSITLTAFMVSALQGEPRE
ncbi:MAG: protoglobin domain-containing protein [Ferrovibrio sp.]|uniref:protoglobin domain-containing protein n=1 Tax=Ferrovibrio sp. TaxID=1917215 RepID=UPI0026200CFB|nr:protoglobin domain-containing protein [Ferrovibrio sp.]MCW0235581.1 protoglobin domain-containing protein [Ferrovibrio sp.]